MELISRLDGRVQLVAGLMLLLLLVGLIDVIVEPATSISREPTFAYATAEMGNNGPLCAGDALEVNIVGHSDGNAGEAEQPASASQIFGTVYRQEGDRWVRAYEAPGISRLSLPNEPGDFDFWHRVPLPELELGNYLYIHAFFSVNVDGATRLRGFSSAFEIRGC